MVEGWRPGGDFAPYERLSSSFSFSHCPFTLYEIILYDFIVLFVFKEGILVSCAFHDSMTLHGFDLLFHLLSKTHLIKYNEK